MKGTTPFRLFASPLIFLILLFYSCNPSPVNISIIPVPVEMKVNRGDFSFTKQTILTWNKDSDSSSARIFNDYLQKYYGFRLVEKAEGDETNQVIILDREEKTDLPKEGYELNVLKHQ